MLNVSYFYVMFLYMSDVFISFIFSLVFNIQLCAAVVVLKCFINKVGLVLVFPPWHCMNTRE